MQFEKSGTAVSLFSDVESDIMTCERRSAQVLQGDECRI